MGELIIKINKYQMSELPKYIIGIDPGMSGAIVVFCPDEQFLRVHEMPCLVEEFTKDGKKKKRKISDLKRICEILEFPPDQTIVVLEHVQARPGNGSTSSWRFAESFGALQGICWARGIPIHLVRPQKWKGVLGLIGLDKNASRGMASKLFPEQKKHFRLVRQDGSAEAALIAYYGWMHLGGDITKLDLH